MRLLLLRIAQAPDMGDGLAQSRLEIGKIDGLGQKIEGAAIHRCANVQHVAVSRHDDGGKLALGAAQPFEQRQAVHARHVDVSDDEVDLRRRFDALQRLDAIAGEVKHESTLTDLATEFLPHEVFQIGLVVDDEDRVGHGAPLNCDSLASIARRNSGKSIGLTKRAAAPSAWARRRVSASP